jgi:hypothetical protein
MLGEALSTDYFLDLTRPLRASFRQHNYLLRTERSGTVYQNWCLLQEGLLHSELGQYNRLTAAYEALSATNKAQIGASVDELLFLVEICGEFDKVVPRTLKAAPEPCANFLRAAFT